MNETVRHSLISACRVNLSERRQSITESLARVLEARDGETKSSAGDKYETGRAHLQSEEARLRDQLDQVDVALLKLNQAEQRKDPMQVSTGHIVVTKRVRYFIAIGLGKLNIADVTYLCISPESPVGQALIGKRVGDVFQFREMTDTIVEIA